MSDAWVLETLKRWPPPWWGADWHPTETAPLHVREGAPGAWRRWFAWYPVRLNSLQSRTQPTAWLRIVERRTFQCAPWFIDGNRTYEQFRFPSQQSQPPTAATPAATPPSITQVAAGNPSADATLSERGA